MEQALVPKNTSADAEALNLCVRKRSPTPSGYRYDCNSNIRSSPQYLEATRYSSMSPSSASESSETSDHFSRKIVETSREFSYPTTTTTKTRPIMSPSRTSESSNTLEDFPRRSIETLRKFQYPTTTTTKTKSTVSPSRTSDSSDTSDHFSRGSIETLREFQYATAATMQARSTVSPCDASESSDTSDNFSRYGLETLRRFQYATAATMQPRSTISPCSAPESGVASENFSQRGIDTLREFPYPIPPTTKTRSTRPFKAFPKNPLNMSYDIQAPLFDKETQECFEQFKEQWLRDAPTQNGTNKNMRRISTNAKNGQNDDPTYWEKRRKNNEAAKRSRDARRAKEDEIAIRCAFLQQYNIRLRIKLSAVEEQLKSLMYR